MFRRKMSLLVALCLLAAVPGPASAAAILYANLPNAPGYSANTDAWTINYGYAVSNSFILPSASVATGVDFLSWGFAPITSVDWVISSGDVYNGYGTTYGSGTASVASAFQFTNSWGYYIWNNSFNLGGVALGPGSYYLTLMNAAAGGQAAYWDQNDGPSTAWESPRGKLPDGEQCLGPCTGSESFDITGEAGNPIPEPASLILLGSGLVGLRSWRKRKQ